MHCAGGEPLLYRPVHFRTGSCQLCRLRRTGVRGEKEISGPGANDAERRAVDALKETRLGCFAEQSQYATVEVPEGGLQQDYNRLMSTLTDRCGDNNYMPTTSPSTRTAAFYVLRNVRIGIRNVMKSSNALSLHWTDWSSPAWPEPRYRTLSSLFEDRTLGVHRLKSAFFKP